MDDQLESLRAAIERSRAAAGRRWLCPLKLKSRVAAYIGERRLAGASIEAIALDLAVSESSVSRWVARVQASQARAQLREVHIDDAEAAPACAGMVLVTPGGYRLEGVSEAMALRLLREL